MNTVDLSLWVNPLYSIKVGEVRELVEESLENTLWFVGTTQSIIDEFEEDIFAEGVEDLHAFLISEIIAQIERLPAEQSLEATILAMDTDTSIQAEDGSVTEVVHFACFHYEDDGTLSIFICHTRFDEYALFIDERKITQELLQ